MSDPFALERRYASLIRTAVDLHFPELLEDLTEHAWLWVLAQAWQESKFDPCAVSDAGAIGIMQLIPGTAQELGVKDPRDPEQNIRGGVRYLADQYRRLREIPTYAERLKFALASYNGGRGYVNRALELARIAEGMPGALSTWRKQGSNPGWWQIWEHARKFLRAQECTVDGLRPDHRQITEYVHCIEGRRTLYAKEFKS